MDKFDQRIFNLSMEFIYGHLSISEFAMLINKSYRQARRIIKKVELSGMLGVKHRNTGKITVNKTSVKFEFEIGHPLKTKYFYFNLTHFREKILKMRELKLVKM